jgi:putative ABC transport system permease protein
LRSKGRTTLVAVMVGVPVMLVVALATLYHTNDISPREALTSQLGQAQARITTTGDTRQEITQSPSANSWSSGAYDAASGPPTAASRPWTLAELQRVTGGRLIPLWQGTTRLSSGQVAISVSATELPLADRQTRGMARLLSGRLPGAGEVALSQGLARQAGWPVGTTLQDLDTHAPVTVVGLYATLGMSNQDRGVLARPGVLHDPADDDRSNASYLLVRQQPVSWAEVQRLNRAGLAVESRSVVLHPPAAATLSDEQRQLSSANPATKAVLVLVIVSIVIEVVLLAGPAFAVGVRRRRRDLALLAATGSTPRDIRRSVLTQAGVIGIGSATAGAVLGLPLAGIGVPIAEHFGAGLGPFDWHWRELATALLVGGTAAVLAALAPAVQAARDDVATVLAGRRGQLRSRPGWPVVGILLVGAGAAADLTRGTRPGGEVWVAAGTIVIVLGAVALTPWLVGQVGRLATHLPLPLRLATRDAARQRSRTAPAVAAIMASVIGITALAIGFASDTKQGRRDYEPKTAFGVASVYIPGAVAQQPVTDAINQVVPGRPILVGRHADAVQPTDGSSRQVVLAAPGCDLTQATGMGESDRDTTCSAAWQRVNANDSFAVYDLATLDAFGVRLDQHAKDVLTSGGALVASPTAMRGDRALIGVVATSADSTKASVVRQLDVPAARLPPATARTARVATVVLAADTAQRLGLVLTPSQVVIGGAELTKGQQDRLNGKLTLLDTNVYVERGYQQPYGLILGLLALVGSLVVLVATVTATGLAMSEARPDLATLAAVGAPPRTRRYVASAQSLVIGLLGTALGVALGFVPGLAVTWPLTAHSYSSYAPPVGGADGPVIAIPWTLLLVVALAVPLFAGLLTGLLTRSRLPMVRRLAT